MGEEVKSITRKAMTEGVLVSARAAIDGASLVFAHSVLDDCAWSYLRVSSLAKPADWEPLIIEKKVSLAECYVKSQDTIRKEMIQEKLEQLGNESLLKKLDLLFQLCKPPRGFAPINYYTYDRNRLKRIDDTRHQIVHRNGMGKPVVKIDDDLDFILKTGNYLLALLRSTYGVQINPAKALNLPPPPEAAQG